MSKHTISRRLDAAKLYARVSEKEKSYSGKKWASPIEIHKRAWNMDNPRLGEGPFM